ncbi:MAG: dihydrofolate reductase family protein [Intrasporangium sp.]|uniref:dihydrofolate reductase family protein n=1 Tax=Intrasporangium sp. TaxID=1925024 RepID=UPI0026474BC7|nr:dihydrofolate reductase family protein [Intrasporangium sp.]MDN5794366.1 dihydrofolate reductase family protein [Intrasporangium sp.]
MHGGTLVEEYVESTGAVLGGRTADGKNLEVFSPSIGRQLLELGLIDEIDLHVAPVLLGAGIRLFDVPGGADVRLDLVNGGDPSRAVNLRYRPHAAT